MTPSPSAAAAQLCPLSVVIINYRTAETTSECLAALAPGIVTVPGSRAVVVDNQSGDGSPERLEALIAERGWDWAEVIRSPINGGFSSGNNVGIQHREAEAYLLLNSDAFVHPDALAEMVNGLRQNPEAGLLSPRLLHVDGSLHHSCYRSVTPISELLRSAKTGLLVPLFKSLQIVLPHPDEPSEPEWTSFACVLIRNDALKDVGLMDEGYFMYFEDQDYARRVRDAGWKVVNWPTAKVTHAAGGSGSVRQDIAECNRPPRYYYASRARYLAKFRGRWWLWLANLMWIVGRAVSRSRELVGQKEPHLCENEWRDIWVNCWRPMEPTSLPPRQHP